MALSRSSAASSADSPAGKGSIVTAFRYDSGEIELTVPSANLRLERLRPC